MMKCFWEHEAKNGMMDISISCSGVCEDIESYQVIFLQLPAFSRYDENLKVVARQISCQSF